LGAQVRRQAEEAVAEADVIILVTDGREALKERFSGLRFPAFG